jgi:hypothetical protein
VTVSNPAEVAKTRLQLQGELTRGGGKKVYNNALDVLAKTWKNEGLRGIQRGLPPAVRSGHFPAHSIADQPFSTLTKYDLVAHSLQPSNTYLNCSDFTQRIKARLVALPEFIGLV